MFSFKKSRKGMLDDLFDYMFTIFIIFFMLALIGFIFEHSQSERQNEAKKYIELVYSTNDNLLVEARSELHSVGVYEVSGLTNNLGELNRQVSNKTGKDLFD